MSAPEQTATPIVSCDCLNDCGDDPQVKTGKVQPCRNMLDQQERDRILGEQLAYIIKMCKIHNAAGYIDLVERLQAKLDALTPSGQKVAAWRLPSGLITGILPEATNGHDAEVLAKAIPLYEPAVPVDAHLPVAPISDDILAELGYQHKLHLHKLGSQKQQDAMVSFARDVLELKL